jgi:nucleoside 2-deoxyribosyltransferase
MLKVYFAGSIRGGRQDAALYHRLIAHISSLPDTVVLTEQVGDLNRSLQEQGRTRDAAIYAQDTAWLRACDLVIAECTHPSLGVGYELAYAEKLGRPVYIFYRHQETQLSAMLTGDPYFHIASYEKEEELTAMIDTLLQTR